MTNALGTLIEKMQYDAYGRFTALWVLDHGDINPVNGFISPETYYSDSITQNPYLFQSQRLDPETGLYYFKNRYYDPTHGRFISRDPEGFVDGPNLYAFVNNNPINYVDPMGLSTRRLAPAEQKEVDEAFNKLEGVTDDERLKWKQMRGIGFMVYDDDISWFWPRWSRLDNGTRIIYVRQNSCKTAEDRAKYVLAEMRYYAGSKESDQWTEQYKSIEPYIGIMEGSVDKLLESLAEKAKRMGYTSEYTGEHELTVSSGADKVVITGYANGCNTDIDWVLDLAAEAADQVGNLTEFLPALESVRQVNTVLGLVMQGRSATDPENWRKACSNMNEAIDYALKGIDSGVWLCTADMNQWLASATGMADWAKLLLIYAAIPEGQAFAEFVRDNAENAAYTKHILIELMAKFDATK